MSELLEKWKLFAAVEKTIRGVVWEKIKSSFWGVTLRWANGNTKQAVGYESRIQRGSLVRYVHKFGNHLKPLELRSIRKKI